MQPYSTAMVWPLVAQVALTLVVWVCLYVARFGEMSARRIAPQQLGSSRAAGTLLENVAAADNFRNLFEVPVLFFAIGAILIATGRTTRAELVLAWVFVGLRVLHSAIHLTYNRVVHRFVAYIGSTVCVFVMWALLAACLLRDA